MPTYTKTVAEIAREVAVILNREVHRNLIIKAANHDIVRTVRARTNNGARLFSTDAAVRIAEHVVKTGGYVRKRPA